MPRGDLPGWRQVFVDDFATDVPLGGFPGTAYRSTWSGYDGFKDTSGHGLYSMGRTLSVQGGALDIHLRTEGGQALASAPTPMVGGGWQGQVYGKYTMRFRADRFSGYGMASLLWPASDVWEEGEVDFPEGDFDGTIGAYNHCVGNPSHNCFSLDTGVTYGDWHTASTEWTPQGVTFLLDGKVIGTSTTSPSTPMRWTLQMGTAGSQPPASSQGHVQIDWVSVYSRT